jgi:dihydroorotase-like cyclic amidohydrolase
VIADGDLDHSLHALAYAINARLHLLHNTVRAASALAEPRVGEEVRVNHTVKPRYLHGARGRIIDLDDHNATILPAPPGRPLHQRPDLLSTAPLDRHHPAVPSTSPSRP